MSKEPEYQIWAKSPHSYAYDHWPPFPNFPTRLTDWGQNKSQEFLVHKVPSMNQIGLAVSDLYCGWMAGNNIIIKYMSVLIKTLKSYAHKAIQYKVCWNALQKPMLSQDFNSQLSFVLFGSRWLVALNNGPRTLEKNSVILPTLA